MHASVSLRVHGKTSPRRMEFMPWTPSLPCPPLHSPRPRAVHPSSIHPSHPPPALSPTSAV
eukprot:366342-Chlamydomonas_euryale.AAC.5